ncbi:anti-sigma factor, partial [Sphingomonas sp. PsM26]|nr:anti-sigma factor [Sphingomonas sp. PsM26]
PEGTLPPFTGVSALGSGRSRLTETTRARADRSAELLVIPGDGPPRARGLLQDTGGTPLALYPTVRAYLAAGAT